MALPGVLPVINRAAVEKTIMAGLALNCTISEHAVFARKNYHYADLPKGYQISQYELPFCRDGWLEIETDAGQKRIGITRAHLEEDTGKLVHAAEGGRLMGPGSVQTLVDLNRAGVPLLEIVTEPDLRSPDEAHAYLTKLQRDPALPGRQHRGHGEGRDALRGQRQRAAARPGSVRDQGRGQEPQLLPVGEAGAGIRGAPADRHTGARRACGAGDHGLG